MKRILILAVAVICMTLTACSNKSSVGVIGGADGPTNIIVGEEGNKKNSRIESIRIANVNGELYYEIDEDSDIEARCGVMDGNFENTVDRYEIPKNSGEASTTSVQVRNTDLQTMSLKNFFSAVSVSEIPKHFSIPTGSHSRTSTVSSMQTVTSSKNISISVRIFPLKCTSTEWLQWLSPTSEFPSTFPQRNFSVSEQSPS